MKADSIRARVPLSILVVDDDMDVREYLEDWLNAEGFEVTALADPALAVAYLRNETFHVCILDLMMPKISGLDLLAQIRTFDRDIAVIILTGYPSLETASAAVAYGVSAYVHKPFAPAEMRKVFERIVKTKGITLGPAAHFRAEIGRAVRARRMALGLTLEQLARRANLTAGLLSRIELASTTANLNDLVSVAQALDCDPADLVPRISAGSEGSRPVPGAPAERSAVTSKTSAIDLVPLIVGGMMHDMRNQLFVLSGNLERMERHHPAGGKLWETSMSAAEWAVERLRSVIDLLHLTVAPHYSPHPGAVDFTALQDVGISCRRRFKHSAPDARLRIRGFASIPRLALPKGLTLWIVEELVQNAINACAKHSRPCTVTLTATHDRSSRTLKLTAEDTGPGFPDHILEHYGGGKGRARAETLRDGHGLALLSTVAGRLDGALVLRNQPQGARIDLLITVGASDAT